MINKKSKILNVQCIKINVSVQKTRNFKMYMFRNKIILWFRKSFIFYDRKYLLLQNC